MGINAALTALKLFPLPMALVQPKEYVCEHH